jgi:hypothetical protein
MKQIDEIRFIRFENRINKKKAVLVDRLANLSGF